MTCMEGKCFRVTAYIERVCYDRPIPLALASSAIFCWSLAEMPMMSLGVSPLSYSNCLT